MGLRFGWRRVLEKTAGRFALVAMTTAIVLVCAACTSQGPSSSSAPINSSKNSSSSASTPTEETANEPGEPAENDDPREAEVTVDLSDPKDRYGLNVFLSNFSEVWWGQKDFDVEQASAEELASFAVYHCARNSQDDWEFAKNNDQRYDILGKGEGAEGRYNVRVKADRVAEIVECYFGKSIDFSELSGEYRGPYHYVDGYVYFGVTNGYGAAEGVALAKQVQRRSDGALVVDFDVYPNFAGGYDPADEKLYSMEPDVLEALFNAKGRTVPGSATLSVSEGDDGSLEFTLATYSTGSYGIAGGAQGESPKEVSGASAAGEAPDFESELHEIDKDKAADPLMGGTTREMSQASAGYVDRYEKLMGKIVNWLESQPGADAEGLAAEQAKWESRLQEQVDKVAAENAGGTILPLAIAGAKMEMLHDRIEELIARV